MSRQSLFLSVCFLLLPGNSTAGEPATGAVSGDVLAESLSLDVGIALFEPGVDGNDPVVDQLYPAVRKAEALYLPRRLGEHLQLTGRHGAVRIMPDGYRQPDILVKGVLLGSDGTGISIRVSVSDSSGREWYDRVYRSSYVPHADTIPFRSLYTSITSDLEQEIQTLSAADRQRLQHISQLRFAARIAPAIYRGYLQVDTTGIYRLRRLPDGNSPEMLQLLKVRNRYDLFIDTLQGHYGTFADRMEPAYKAWLQESFSEHASLQQLRQQSRNSIIHGVYTVFASLNPVSRFRRTRDEQGRTGISRGRHEILEGFNTRQESRMHEQALEELGVSFNQVIEPHVMQTEQHTVTLTGTVHEQLQQWRTILNELYLLKTGQRE